MSTRHWASGLDAAAVPRLAAWARAAAAVARAITGSRAVRLLHAGLADTGLIGPGIAMVLLAGCLLAVTGAS